MRLAPSRDYLALKAAFRDLVMLAGGPTRAATITRGHVSHISEAGSASKDDRFAAIDQIYDLEVETGSPLVTRALAELHNLDMAPREAQPPRPVLSHLSAIVSECGDVQKALADGMADGSLTEAERKRIVGEAGEAIAALNALISTLTMPGNPRALKAVQ